ncbi:MAG: hypothetical protein RL238_10 [Actinomycetota bacterium]|jgi:hypothetical protein
MYKQSSRRRGPGLVVGVAAGALVTGAIAVGMQLGNPFDTKTVDHSAPPVVLDLRDLADYHAAQGQFEVTIDQEKDVQWVPSVIAGERTQFVAVATVDAVVDFSTLPDGAVQVSDDGASVVVTLPPAYLTEPTFDRTLSHVMNRDRGLLDRVGSMFSDNPTSEEGLYDAADEKIAAAAAATDLQARAEANTTSMLETMLRTMGFERVEVRFQVSSASVA